MKIGKIKETIGNTVGAIGNENVRKVVDSTVGAIGNEKIKSAVGSTVDAIGKVTPVVGKVANVGMTIRKVAIIVAVAIGMIIALILSFKLGQWSGKRSVAEAEVADAMSLCIHNQVAMTCHNALIS